MLDVESKGPEVSSDGLREDLLERARTAAAVIEREANAIEEKADLTDVVREALRQSGLFWMGLPSEFGGSNADVRTALEVMEEIARADGSTGWSFFCNVVATTGAYANTSDKVIAEMFGGRDRAVLCGQFAPIGKAVPVEGGFRVTGRHQFASGSINATWLAAGQTIYGEDGKPLLDDSGQPKTIVSYFPKAKIMLRGNWDVTGLNGTGSVDYEIPEQFVPEEHTLSGAVLTPEGASNNHRGGPLCQVGNFTMGPAGHAAVALGMTKRALQEIAAIATTKRRMGSPLTVSASELFRYDFVRYEQRYWEARGYMMSVAEEVEGVRRRGRDITPGLQARVIQMNHFIHQTAREIIGFCSGWAGSAIVRNPSTLARLTRDITVAVNHYINDRSYILNVAPALIERWKPS